jgi:hypothetical protein
MCGKSDLELERRVDGGRWAWRYLIDGRSTRDPARAKVDPSDVRVIYEKQTPIDLTDRLRKYVTGEGIDMPDAEVPPGTYLLRVEVTDSLGRKSVSEVKLLVQ